MICFDTAPLIWGVQGKANKDQEHLVSRTKAYISHLAKRKTKVVLPATVMAEYLAWFPREEQALQAKILQRCFVIIPFDCKAACLAAELEQAKPVREIQAHYKIDRQTIKADVQIVAAAIVFKADAIVSHDCHLQAIAGNRISVIEVPSVSEQIPLELVTAIGE